MATTNKSETTNTATVAVHTMSDSEMTLHVLGEMMEHAIADLASRGSRAAATEVASARLIVLDAARDERTRRQAQAAS